MHVEFLTCSMMWIRRVGGLSLILLAAQIAARADSRPADEFAGLKKEADAAVEVIDRVQGAGPGEMERDDRPSEAGALPHNGDAMVAGAFQDRDGPGGVRPDSVPGDSEVVTWWKLPG
jgi:hypothetical protein